MAQCSEIDPLLGAFDDGELEAHEMREVARHLAHCAACEETLAAYGNLGRLLRDAAPVPPLDGFARAVQSRIERLRPPMRVRLGRWLETMGERFGAAAGLALAAAVLAVVIVTPLARNLLGSGDQAIQVAMREPSTIISQLETSNPDVAVWSEPAQDTTVIWLPDRQP